MQTFSDFYAKAKRNRLKRGKIKRAKFAKAGKGPHLTQLAVNDSKQLLNPNTRQAGSDAPSSSTYGLKG